MNHYEELGLPQKASPEEVHEAYRGLARLLHPDQQQDERLRRLAECQMKRLNDIHAVLSDPVRRRRYDLELEAGAGEPLALTVVAEPPARRGDLRDAWLFAGAIAVFSCWMAATSVAPHASGPPVLREVSTTTPAAPSAARARLRAAPAVRSGTSTREARPPSPHWARTNEPPANQPEAPMAPLAAIPPPGLPPVTETLLGNAQSTPPSEENLFAGAWVYIPPRLPVTEPSLYPPEFIETVIVEEAGTILGRYHARYRIADRAISPEVRFHFRGKSAGDHASLDWRGAGGAEGEVHLQLLKPGLMELKWAASALGSQLGLASGTAILIRRVER